MGQYFKIVNVTKKQFIDISELGESNKFSFIGQGLHGIALGRLLASVGDAMEEWYTVYGHPHEDDLYVGAWAGDSIVIAGDYALPDKSEVQSTTSEPDVLNLYFKVVTGNGYENITGKVIKWLAKDGETADLLAERALIDEQLLYKLNELAFANNNETIKNSLDKIHGSKWKLKKKR
jgi:hypothetical protein